MEIITGVERRRHWRTEDKLRIVAEAERPGARFGDVARRHEVSRGLLWQWRDQARRGVLVAEPAPVFVPVQVTADPPAPRLEPPAGPSAAAGDAGRGEIMLPDGRSEERGVGEEWRSRGAPHNYKKKRKYRNYGSMA